jgi:chlorite dismutase
MGNCCEKPKETITERNNRIWQEVVEYVNTNYSYMSRYNRSNYIKEIYYNKILELDNDEKNLIYGRVVL